MRLTHTPGVKGPTIAGHGIQEDAVANTQGVRSISAVAPSRQRFLLHGRRTTAQISARTIIQDQAFGEPVFL